jgi:hypothetical protein
MTNQTWPKDLQSADLSATDFYELADDRLSVGETPATIVRELVARGLDADAAGRIVETVEATRQANRLSVARRNMIFGGAAVIAGASVTALTFTQVAESGGYFYVFPVAIVFGAIQFIWGWVQLRMV